MSPDPRTLAAQLKALVAKANTNDRGVQDGLSEMVEGTFLQVPGAKYAGITLAHHRDGISNVVATGPYPALSDEIQNRHQEGPCAAAAWRSTTIHVENLESDERWPQYRSDVLAETPIRSILAFRLFITEGNVTGALNFYAERACAFSNESIELGLIVATHISIAWTALRGAQDFRSALASRDVIGQAKGMIMERYHVDAVRAFELLRALSQTSNTKLFDVAQALIAAEFRPSPND